MKIEEVKKLSPVDRFFYWITERERVRRFKEAEQPKPWTDDEILQSYRFCNVRRMDDKVSRWLLVNWYTHWFNHPHMLPAVAVARFINQPASLDEITQLVFSPRWNRLLMQERLRNYRDRGNTVFNGAYMVRGNDGMDKIECVFKYYVDPLFDVIKQIDRTSMERTWAAILQSYGMGSFMAGQIVADLRWALKGTWEDKHDWAPIGPGSQRGLNRFLELPLKTTWKQGAFVEELMKVKELGRTELTKGISDRLEAHDWQNCFCEYDKYTRVLHGEGRPKAKYPGV